MYIVKSGDKAAEVEPQPNCRLSRTVEPQPNCNRYVTSIGHRIVYQGFKELPKKT